MPRIHCLIYIFTAGLHNTVEPCYNAVVGVHDFGPRCTRGALGVLITATRELLNNSDRRTKSMMARKLSNMQFMELIKLIMLASTCIIFKCHALLILELNKTHVHIPLWNRSTVMMMYWIWPTNRK